MPIHPTLIDALHNQKCLVVLGHDALQLPNQKKYYQQVLAKVAATFSDDTSYKSDEEFMYVAPTVEKQVYEYVAKEYKKIAMPTYYEKLAAIPFFMLVNTSPDTYLKTLFETKQTNGFQFIYDYYQAQVTPNPVAKTNNEAPLLYNLFGTVDLPTTLVFSYNKLFGYMDSLIGQKYKLHPSMTAQIVDAQSIVFLGLPFNRIYLNMIFWLLGLQHMQYKKFASGTHYAETLEFVKKQFTVSFVNENIEEFIDELYAECQVENLLRTFQAPKVRLTDYNNVQEGVSKRKQELLELLEGLEYAKIFEELDKIGMQKMKVEELRQESMHHNRAYDFNERMKIFINSLAI
jgi:hypothetical protein